MLKIRLIVWALGLAAVCFNQCFADELVWENIAKENVNLSAVLIEGSNPQIIYLGGQGGILKTMDAGQTWRQGLNIHGQNRSVNFLLSAPDNAIYAATGNGLFYSANQGKNWQRIFRARDYLENECTVIGMMQGVIYLGTKKGLFLSRDKARTWQKQKGGLSDEPILSIAVQKPGAYIYAVCLSAVYRSKSGSELWEKIFISHSAGNNDETDEDAEDYNDEQEEQSVYGLRYITVDDNAGYIYLATSKGIYRSINQGADWELMTDYGLFERDIKSVLVSNSVVYAGTKSAIFRFDGARWNEVSLGLGSQDIRFIALDREGSLYAVCDNGLFKANAGDAPISSVIKSLYCHNEPDIAKVQKAAIKYAEVEPEKIMHWRKQAAKKAWLPQVSLGLDRDTTDLWHWEGGSTTKVDDDTLRRGRDTVEWDVSVSWDLSELIWNSDQTSIDVRSRLMVELRQDILDEVTKLYFERLRVKMELDSLSIEERKKRFEKELKLKELTALLDGLTNGYFSAGR